MVLTIAFGIVLGFVIISLLPHLGQIALGILNAIIAILGVTGAACINAMNVAYKQCARCVKYLWALPTYIKLLIGIVASTLVCCINFNFIPTIILIWGLFALFYWFAWLSAPRQ